MLEQATRLEPATVRRRAGFAFPAGTADVLTSWAAARVVTLAALALAAFIRRSIAGRGGHLPGGGLLSWDASWYLNLATHGYAGAPAEGIRFFPLYPAAAHGLGLLIGSVPAALLALANAAALAYGFLLHRLVVHEGLGAASARRVVWIAAFAPAGFVLVMGYAEAVFGCLTVGCLLAARRRRWFWAATFGLLAGATRPTGVLLAVFLLVEALREPPVSPRDAAPRGVAVLAPVAGLGSYLGWAWLQYGDALRPLRVQTAAGLRGGAVVNPIAQAAHLLRGLSGGGTVGSALHLPWLAAALVLLIVVIRRLPSSYAALAVVTLLPAVTGRGFASFERYAAGSVPLLVAAAVLLSGRLRATAALAVGSAVMFGYALLSFLHLYVP